MIGVVDYNAGNTRSLMNRLDALGIRAVLSSDPDFLAKSSKLIFPGVGAAKAAMYSLKQRELIECLRSYSQPFLGICLGMQLMGKFSAEGEQELLGLMDFRVEAIQAITKVPHMGWNSLQNLKGPLFKGLKEKSDVYFVHSYYVEPKPYTAATCSYGKAFSAAIQKDHFFGCQFHPEKSGSNGSLILKNFNRL